MNSVLTVFDNVYGVLRGYKFASDFAVTFSYGYPDVGVGRDSMVIELYLGDADMGVFRDWLERVSNDSEFEVSAVSAKESGIESLRMIAESVRGMANEKQRNQELWNAIVEHIP